MQEQMVNVSGMEIPVYSLNTLIVGSGAAGLNAADSLHALGVRDVAILTEKLGAGTSFNAGSDKQTYYKLTMAGGAADSVLGMVETLFSGGAMHGDTALIEAALSPRCFFKLVEAGVPFPMDAYGQYAGYKTDHDPRQRATSAGPLTSRFMGEVLAARIRDKGIRLFEGFLAVAVLTDGEGDERRCSGVLALELGKLGSLALFRCVNVVWATGGPAGLYADSVYPESQFGSLGAALEAGARGVNLTESQYGIASVKFRWNLSGSYQQVLPRYVSTDQDGNDEREFLAGSFPRPGAMLDAVFLKGYQWPFDARKTANFGSSLIDLLVHRERACGRRVFLDYTRNPCAAGDGALDFSLLGQEAHSYLANCGVLSGTPFERLKRMNEPAIRLFRDHSIDLETERLEIAVCAQHSNGGLLADTWWESNIKHFFPVGEACGTHGVYRPGGSALNATQVGSLRAAERIASTYAGIPQPLEEFLPTVLGQVTKQVGLIRSLLSNSGQPNVLESRAKAQARMSRAGAFIRSPQSVEEALAACRNELARFAQDTCVASAAELPDAFRNLDMLITQLAFFSAIREYMEQGGGSRGGFLVSDPEGEPPFGAGIGDYRHKAQGKDLTGSVCEVEFSGDQLRCRFDWKQVRPVPKEEPWFETVWRDYRARRGLE